jgi:AAA family ATP:ADP antiporter
MHEKASGFVYKFLRLFSVVHPGEALTVLLLALNVFLIGASYSILKPVRKGLILTAHSAEQETYLFAIVAVLLIFVVKIFSALSSKIPRQKLITSVTLFFISNLVVFFVLREAGTSISVLGVIFWVWLSIFNVFIIAQFWAFTNDVYSEEAGKRLFPIVMFAQNMGFYLGAQSTSLLVKPKGPFSPFQLMLVTGFILMICIALTLIVHRKELKKSPKQAIDQKADKSVLEKAEEKPLKKGGGFRIIFQSKYLILVALVILSLNYVNTTGEYIRSSVWQKTTTEAVESGKIENTEEARLEFYTKTESDFTSIVNLLTMLIQLFLVSRILKWFGVRGAMLFLPFIALGGYFLIGLGASYALVRWTKTAENSTDYSLMNTIKQAFYLITSREAKYKAKAAIDTFFVRTGDVLVSLTIFIGTTTFALGLESFAKINVAVVIIWIILSLLTIKEHKRLSAKKAGDNQPLNTD